MATVLDLGFISNFSYLFTFLLVFVLVFSILESKKFLSQSTGVNGIIALCLAIIVNLSSTARTAITNAAPWFVALAFFIFFLLLLYTIFGAGEKDFKEVLKDIRVVNWIIALSVIIALIALGNALGQSLLSRTTNQSAITTELNTTATNTTSYQTNLVNTLFNSKVLGLILLLIIASFTIRQLSMKDE